MRCLLALITALVVVWPQAATAQELPPPPVAPPQLPEPAAEALTMLVEAATPAANEAAQELAPVASGSGFAFRPACSAMGSVMVATFLTAAYFPMPVGFGTLTGPLVIFCAHTYESGPVDPVFAEADSAVGPTLSDALSLSADEISQGLGPLRESDEFAEACGYTPLLAAPLTSVPPPANRVDLLRLICG